MDSYYNVKYYYETIEKIGNYISHKNVNMGKDENHQFLMASLYKLIEKYDQISTLSIYHSSNIFEVCKFIYAHANGNEIKQLLLSYLHKLLVDQKFQQMGIIYSDSYGEFIEMCVNLFNHSKMNDKNAAIEFYSDIISAIKLLLKKLPHETARKILTKQLLKPLLQSLDKNDFGENERAIGMHIFDMCLNKTFFEKYQQEGTNSLMFNHELLAQILALKSEGYIFRQYYLQPILELVIKNIKTFECKNKFQIVQPLLYHFIEESSNKAYMKKHTMLNLNNYHFFGIVCELLISHEFDFKEHEFDQMDQCFAHIILHCSNLSLEQQLCFYLLVAKYNLAAYESHIFNFIKTSIHSHQSNNHVIRIWCKLIGILAYFYSNNRKATKNLIDFIVYEIIPNYDDDNNTHAFLDIFIDTISKDFLCKHWNFYAYILKLKSNANLVNKLTCVTLLAKSVDRISYYNLLRRKDLSQNYISEIMHCIDSFERFLLDDIKHECVTFSMTKVLLYKTYVCYYLYINQLGFQSNMHANQLTNYEKLAQTYYRIIQNFNPDDNLKFSLEKLQLFHILNINELHINNNHNRETLKLMEQFFQAQIDESFKNEFVQKASVILNYYWLHTTNQNENNDNIIWRLLGQLYTISSPMVIENILSTVGNVEFYQIYNPMEQLLKFCHHLLGIKNKFRMLTNYSNSIESIANNTPTHALTIIKAIINAKHLHVVNNNHKIIIINLLLSIIGLDKQNDTILKLVLDTITYTTYQDGFVECVFHRFINFNSSPNEETIKYFYLLLTYYKHHVVDVLVRNKLNVDNKITSSIHMQLIFCVVMKLRSCKGINFDSEFLRNFYNSQIALLDNKFEEMTAQLPIFFLKYIKFVIEFDKLNIEVCLTPPLLESIKSRIEHFEHEYAHNVVILLKCYKLNITIALLATNAKKSNNNSYFEKLTKLLEIVNEQLQFDDSKGEHYRNKFENFFKYLLLTKKYRLYDIIRLHNEGEHLNYFCCYYYLKYIRKVDTLSQQIILNLFLSTIKSTNNCTPNCWQLQTLCLFVHFVVKKIEFPLSTCGLLLSQLRLFIETSKNPNILLLCYETLVLIAQKQSSKLNIFANAIFNIWKAGHKKVLQFHSKRHLIDRFLSLNKHIVGLDCVPLLAHFYVRTLVQLLVNVPHEIQEDFLLSNCEIIAMLTEDQLSFVNNSLVSGETILWSRLYRIYSEDLKFKGN